MKLCYRTYKEEIKKKLAYLVNSIKLIVLVPADFPFLAIGHPGTGQLIILCSLLSAGSHPIIRYNAKNPII
jgi:hypothetical protein